MKREILFRGQVLPGSWIHGNYTQDIFGGSIIEHLTGDGVKMRRCMYNVSPETIGQFIGRTDKHGTKIFEGDYLADRYTEDGVDYVTKLPVMWDNEKLCWSVDTSFAGDGSHSQPIADFFGDTELEVIGNIWDNQEKHGGDGK